MKKVLHILKSEPDDTVEKLCEETSATHTASVIPLYEGQVNWPGLVDDIFSHDKVICWW